MEKLQATLTAGHPGGHRRGIGIIPVFIGVVDCPGGQHPGPHIGKQAL